MADNIEPNVPVASRTPYEKTLWVNDVTPLNATNMNKIENGIETNSLLSNENAVYLDELQGTINDMDISFDSVNNQLTLIVGTAPTVENRTRYFYKKSLLLEPKHTTASEDDINNLFL